MGAKSKADRIRALTPEYDFERRRAADIDSYEAAQAWRITHRAARDRLMDLVVKGKMTTCLVKDSDHLHPIRIWREVA